MKVLIIIIMVMLILAILSILTLANKLVALDGELKKLDKQFKESSFDISKLICYRDSLEKRITKFNDNAYKYKEEVKSEFESINNDIKLLYNKEQHFTMELGKVRNALKSNTNDLITLMNKLTEHLKK